MRLCKMHFENIPGSPYSQSKMHDVPMLDRESHDDYDIRTWRDHCTTNAGSQICVPSMACKQCIDTGAYKLGHKVPDRRGAVYHNFFASGYYCNADVPLANGKPWLKDDVEMICINANADGKRGSGKRVKRRYPMIPEYQGIAEFTILDDIITRDEFEVTARAAGIIVGIGRYRAEKGGTNGRFRITRFEWEDIQF